MQKSLDIKIADHMGRLITIGTLARDLETGKVTFTKEVERAKHFMRLSNSYGIQKEIFDKYLRKKLVKIIIIEKDTGSVLTSMVRDWEEHASHQNYGHGRQMFLSEKYMTKEVNHE